ncbi:MAG TPA: hypothetical protein VHK06_03085 [Candidatus Limnocylindria bacterium]|nr:hypothetical protein [Candidatus Limnocylindria bacterium]
MQFTACQGALLSNDPDKAAQLEALGITVVGHTIHLPLPLLAA